jgi:hypothetical protein
MTELVADASLWVSDPWKKGGVDPAKKDSFMTKLCSGAHEPEL